VEVANAMEKAHATWQERPDDVHFLSLGFEEEDEWHCALATRNRVAKFRSR
jgi:hypothetical protein